VHTRSRERVKHSRVGPVVANKPVHPAKASVVGDMLEVLGLQEAAATCLAKENRS
jgi:hypothetical protein